MRRMQNIKRVAIIGGGPSGVAMAKYLLAEDTFTTIDVFEQRSTCAGLWNYTPERHHEAQFTVPSTKPYTLQEDPLWRKGRDGNPRVDPFKKHTVFISPLYERLEANLPKMLMQYSDLAFPDEEQLFPTHEAIAEYLERYADDVRHLIQFETQVTEVKATDCTVMGRWSITTEDLARKEQQTREYDAVAVATGHFNVPFIPDIPGIREWNTQYPETIIHSKYYRKPEEFTGLKTITVGVNASGSDIANQVERFCSLPLLVSSRANPTPASPDPSVRHNLGEIAEFIPSTRAIRFKSPEGHIEHNVDRILFCTGYLYSYPGFDQTAPPFESFPLLASPTPGVRTHGVYQHMFYSAVPTLAFLSLPQWIVPFPVAQNQAAVIARVWSGRLGLPSFEAMVAWEQDRVKDSGEGKIFHYMKNLDDARYLNMLHDWAMSSEHAKTGKGPLWWGERECWMRKLVFEMKGAFAALGEGRHTVKTLEQLGYDFEKSRSGQELNGDRNHDIDVLTNGHEA